MGLTPQRAENTLGFLGKVCMAGIQGSNVTVGCFDWSQGYPVWLVSVQLQFSPTFFPVSSGPFPI